MSLVDRRGYLTVVLEIDGDLGLVVRKPDLSNQMLGQPEPNNVKHGEGVVLVLQIRLLLLCCSKECISIYSF